MPRLLIMSCGSLKQTTAAPAGELYLGASFLVYRKYVAENPSHDVRVAILSARHGLICPSTIIEPYDVKMTRSRAAGMNASCLNSYRVLVDVLAPYAVYWNLSRVYARALVGAWCYSESTPTMDVRRLGHCLASLKSWLNDPAFLPSAK